MSYFLYRAKLFFWRQKILKPNPMVIVFRAIQNSLVIVSVAWNAACHYMLPPSSATSELKSPPSTSSQNPFRDDIIPKLGWTCSRGAFKSEFIPIGDGGSGSYRNISMKNEFTIEWLGKLDPSGKPVNEYLVTYEANIPAGIKFEGDRKKSTTVILKTQLAADSSLPFKGENLYLRSFKFVTKSDTNEVQDIFTEKEPYQDPSQYEPMSIVRRFDHMKLVLNKNQMILPDPVEFRTPHQNFEADCYLKSIYIRSGDPIQLVHATDGGLPMVLPLNPEKGQKQKTQKIAEGKVDIVFPHLKNISTVGTLSLPMAKLKEIFTKNYVSDRYTKDNEIAVLDEYGIHIGSKVFKSDKKYDWGKDPSASLSISSPLATLLGPSPDNPTLILWNSSSVYVPRGLPAPRYIHYGLGSASSSEFTHILCTVALQKASCSEEESTKILGNLRNAVHQMEMLTPKKPLHCP
jgi:hypothetical protein